VLRQQITQDYIPDHGGEALGSVGVAGGAGGGAFVVEDVSKLALNEAEVAGSILAAGVIEIEVLVDHR
jgi:hypothetical protein